MSPLDRKALEKRFARRQRSDPEEAWNEYLAGLFKLEGDKTLIRKLQGKTIRRMGRVIKLAYSGEISREEYLRRAVENVSSWYLAQLVRYGLASRQFDESWIGYYREEGLRAIEEEVPYKTTGITAREQMKICDRICPLSKTFFEGVHREFGIPELKANPDVYHPDIYTDPDE